MIRQLKRWLSVGGSHMIAVTALLSLFMPLILVLKEGRHVIISAIRQALSSFVLRREVFNSVLVALSVALVCTIVAPGAGHALSLRRLPFRRVWMAVTVLAAVAPVTMLLVPGEILLASVNLRDSLWGIGLLHTGLLLPVAIWIMKTAFEQIPSELIEAARFEGATPFRLYRTVALPLVRGARWAAFGIVFALSWGEYVASVTLLSRPAGQTITAALIAGARYGVGWDHLLPGMLIAALPCVVLFGIVQIGIGRWTGFDRLLK